MKLDQIDHVAITVSDLARSVEWYQTVLGLERRWQEVWELPVMLCAGATCLALFPADVSEPRAVPDPSRTIALRHFAFRVSRAAFEQAQTELRTSGIEFTFEDHAVSHSIYVLDPDGYRIELTTWELL